MTLDCRSPSQQPLGGPGKALEAGARVGPQGGAIISASWRKGGAASQMVGHRPLRLRTAVRRKALAFPTTCFDVAPHCVQGAMGGEVVLSMLRPAETRVSPTLNSGGSSEVRGPALSRMHF